jgi:sugar phosphate isomerase/epimerase
MKKNHLKKEDNRTMRFGAMNSPLKPILSEIESVASMGFDYVEITMDAPEAHYFRLRERLDEVIGAIQRLNLGLICHLPTYVSAADLTPGIREASLRELKHSLDVAKELGAERVVVHPPHATGIGKKALKTTRRNSIESLNEVLEKAYSLGLLASLENMTPGSFSLSEPDDFREVFKDHPQVEMTLDLGHAHIASENEDRTLAFIGRFSSKIGHIHLSDNRGLGDDHLPVGAGSVNFQKIIKELRSFGYDNTMTLEIFSPDSDYLIMSREKIRAMME